MKNRIELDNEFRRILGSSNVYFQPPESIKMKYPCIRYKLNRIDTDYSNNGSYNLNPSYTGAVISKNPDDSIINDILKLSKSRFDRFYVADGLNHWVFIIYL